MKKKETKKRTSSYDQNRQCYMSKDGTAYYYERWNEDYGRYEKIPLTVGLDGITEEIILLLDSMDREEDLGNRYENENKGVIVAPSKWRNDKPSPDILLDNWIRV